MLTQTPPPEPEKAEYPRIDAFLEEVYALAKVNDLDAATDRIFDFIDRLLCEDDFLLCDQVLKRIDIEKLPTALMRSFLTITSPAKDRLPSRKALYCKIEKKMVELKGAEKTQRIIGKLA